MSKPMNTKGDDMSAESKQEDKLTPEQIKNWRNVLCGMLGAYAFLMSDEDVQAMRDTMQEKMGIQS